MVECVSSYATYNIPHTRAYPCIFKKRNSDENSDHKLS